MFHANYTFGIITSIYFASSISVLFISLMQSVNGAQFLQIASFCLSVALFAASFAPAPVIVIVPATSMYVSL